MSFRTPPSIHVQELLSLNQGVTGFEPSTHVQGLLSLNQVATNCSTTELYTRVTHLCAFMYKKPDQTIISFLTVDSSSP